MPSTTRNRSIFGILKLVCVAAGIAVAHRSEAQVYDWSVHAGVDQSDNIRRTNVDEESQTVAEVGLELKLDAKRPRLDANVDANVSYRDYLDNAYDDDTVGGVNGTAVFGLLPGRFTWLVQDNFGQVASDPLQVETPGNRQNINYFITGPDLIVPLGARTTLNLQGRWADSYFETTPDDYRRYSGSLGLAQQLSGTSSVSINASTARIEYEQSPPNSDYDVQEAYLRFSATGLHTTLTTDLGYTVLHDFGESNDGVLARLSMSRKVGARSTVQLDVGTEFSDTANVFQRDQTLRGVQLENSTATASNDAFQADYGYASWRTDGDRGTFGLSGQWRKESHETQSQLDRKLIGAYADLSRRLSQRTTLSFNGSYSHDDFSEQGVHLDEWSIGGELNFQLGRNVAAQLRITHYDGSGTGAERTYEENRAYAGISYSGSR